MDVVQTTNRSHGRVRDIFIKIYLFPSSGAFSADSNLGYSYPDSIYKSLPLKKINVFTPDHLFGITHPLGAL